MLTSTFKITKIMSMDRDKVAAAITWFTMEHKPCSFRALLDRAGGANGNLPSQRQMPVQQTTATICLFGNKRIETCPCSTWIEPWIFRRDAVVGRIFHPEEPIEGFCRIHSFHHPTNTRSRGKDKKLPSSKPLQRLKLRISDEICCKCSVSPTNVGA